MECNITVKEELVWEDDGSYNMTEWHPIIRPTKKWYLEELQAEPHDLIHQSKAT